MNEKVLMIADEFGDIGTANDDNCSMRLNVKASILLRDAEVSVEVESKFGPVRDGAASIE
jgi:hypothetical protein